MAGGELYSMIHNVGSTPQPSVRSFLTINRPNMGGYVCFADGIVSTVDLQVVEGRL